MKNSSGLFKVYPCAMIIAMSLACGGDQGAKDSGATVSETPNIKTGVKPVADSEAAVIETDFGRIVIELYPNIAPKMVERFKTLTKEGFYNGTAFHRVEPTANVIQAGDPNSKDDDPNNDGMGGSTYPDVPSEASDLPFEAGTVGAADAGLNTANSQFYITLGRMPQWEGRYTVFGKVIDGLNNARVISTAPTREGTTNPDPKVVIKSITLQPRSNF